MGSPQECSTLLRIIGEALKCEARCSAAETPSHVDKDDEGGLIPRGCLIAHLSLTLIEMQRVSPYFRASLHNLSAFYSVGGSPSIDAGSYWDLLLTSSILHDIGKLADEYTAMGAVKGDGARHHQISAVIAKKTLENLIDEADALRISYAILLHHEAINWMALERSLLLSSYLQRALSPTRKIKYHVDERRLRKFEENLRDVLDGLCGKGFITWLQHQTLNLTLTESVQKLVENSGAAIDLVQELGAAKIYDLKYFVPALALYRLIYLADNRAASARDPGDRYWLESVQMVDWHRPENTANQIASILARRYRYIGLSSIPR